jgi:predicted NBD/HSP70 family sugar kinase
MGILDTIVARANAGNDLTLQALDEIGRWLGLGIGSLINIFNPELVVLGGFYQVLFPFLETSVVEGARLRSLAAPGEVARITSSGLAADAPLVGAAELALSGVIADPAAAAGLSILGRSPVEGKTAR